MRHRQSLPSLFNWKEEHGKGRCVMLSTSAITKIITELTTGTLYTAFLTACDFNILDVSILSVLPLFASLFGMFSPMILERFPRRKWILAGGRLTYYLTNVLGVTLLPFLVHDQSHRLLAFGALVFLSSIFNHLFASGYSVWHLNFIGEDVRARYFSAQQLSTGVISSLCILGFGLLADALNGTPHEVTILVIIRVVGLLLGLLDIILLLQPKEYPYPRKQKQLKLSNIILLPMQNVKFRRTMLFVAVWQFAIFLPQATWHYYLLNTVGTGVALANLFGILYTVCLLCLTPLWRRILLRHSWLKTFLFAGLIHIPAVFAAAFVTKANYLWLYPLVILVQTIDGVGLNLAWLGFPYLNIPRHDQTYYISFYTFLISFMSFAGQLAATLFLRFWGERTLLLLGAQLTAPQILLVIQTCIDIGCVLVLIFGRRLLEPDPAADRERTDD